MASSGLDELTVAIRRFLENAKAAVRDESENGSLALEAWMRDSRRFERVQGFEEARAAARRFGGDLTSTSLVTIGLGGLLGSRAPFDLDKVAREVANYVRWDEPRTLRHIALDVGDLPGVDGPIAGWELVWYDAEALRSLAPVPTAEPYQLYPAWDLQRAEATYWLRQDRGEAHKTKGSVFLFLPSDIYEDAAAPLLGIALSGLFFGESPNRPPWAQPIGLFDVVCGKRIDKLAGDVVPFDDDGFAYHPPFYLTSAESRSSWQLFISALAKPLELTTHSSRIAQRFLRERPVTSSRVSSLST